MNAIKQMTALLMRKLRERRGKASVHMMHLPPAIGLGSDCYIILDAYLGAYGRSFDASLADKAEAPDLTT